MRPRDQLSKLSKEERIALAKRITERVVDHLLYLLALHENNKIILYSPTLSSQIPLSRAGNAFLVFQRGMHQIEIVRLCALWGSAALNQESIPTIIELIDDPDIIEALASESEAHAGSIGHAIFNPSDDPGEQALIEMASREAEEDFGRRQGQKARVGLSEAITAARQIINSKKLESIVELRDRHLAHSLSSTWRESGDLIPMKYGDEKVVLDKTVPIVELLFCWVKGSSMNFADSQDIDRRNAEALWHACTFKIEK